MNLKPGTLCVIVGGCPANIGLIVEVLAHLGPRDGRADAYHVRTVSGRPFAQLWDETGSTRQLRSDFNLSDCVTDRHKLRPLVHPKAKEGVEIVKRVKGRKRELAKAD
jgi:hypothetical protein